MAGDTASTTAPVAGHIHQLHFARGATLRLLKDFPEESLCAQPGTCINHALWIVGHLAATDDYFLKEFAGRALALDEPWHAAFNMGSTPVADASKYPPAKEMMRVFEERRAALLEWLESLSPTERNAATPEKWQRYAPSIKDLGGFIAWHEGYHAGQLSIVRRALGLPAAFK